MNFSDLIPHSGIAFSHAGSYIAAIKSQDVFLFDASTLAIVTKYNFKEDVAKLKWSPDDSFILVQAAKKNTIHFRAV